MEIHGVIIPVHYFLNTRFSWSKPSEAKGSLCSSDLWTQEEAPSPTPQASAEGGWSRDDWCVQETLGLGVVSSRPALSVEMT